jgi:hypothetical protein
VVSENVSFAVLFPVALTTKLCRCLRHVYPHAFVIPEAHFWQQTLLIVPLFQQALVGLLQDIIILAAPTFCYRRQSYLKEFNQFIWSKLLNVLLWRSLCLQNRPGNLYSRCANIHTWIALLETISFVRRVNTSLPCAFSSWYSLYSIIISKLSCSVITFSSSPSALTD